MVRIVMPGDSWDRRPQGTFRLVWRVRRASADHASAGAGSSPSARNAPRSKTKTARSK
jgi:hypothetical protein